MSIEVKAMTRPGDCPVAGGEPCQLMCLDGCRLRRSTRTHVCPICAASMIERDEALMRQALESLQWSNEYLDEIGKKLFQTSKKAKPGSTSWNVQQAIKALKARLEESK